MDLGFEGKVALLGAGGGLGGAIARTLTGEGAQVAVADILMGTASILVGRCGDPQEYADTVTFLASARASYITGSVIRVDGGLIPSI